jgi:exodeoxyribonuclease V beta subunit
VQVLTIHRSKGLEFPIVYCPFLWEPGYIPGPEVALPVFHDPHAGNERTIDVGGPDGPGYDEHYQLHFAEQRGEDLRLAYVALTRARHQAVIWWAGSFDSRDSPLGRLLFSQDAAGNVGACGEFTPDDPAVLERFAELAAAAPGCVSVERTDGGDGTRWAGEARAAAKLEPGRFARRLDPRWGRTSYTGIVAGTHDARVASEPEEPLVVDEAPTTSPAPGPGEGPQADALRSVPSLLAGVAVGAEVGIFVHLILERADFAAADLPAELAFHVDDERARRRVEVGDAASLVAGLRAAIETPLGPLVGDLRLRDFARADRLGELAFELPLVGGDAPTGDLTVQDIGRLLEEHLSDGDPLVGYAERLSGASLQADLRGYLTGSLDLVLRFRDPDGTQRFAVVDHKTNWLAPPGEPLTAWHYRPAALATAMQIAHYPLQALLYVAVLHRYLRWRLPAYDAGRNLAGVLYLFLRGMSGGATPRVSGQPCGVFAWRPPPGLVEALSDLLDRGAVAA